ncbi:hypothetical protein CIG19_02690 [Enterobacterales bacterium CwR94]|nr:hypothetical protein CIG19_02690 [Enterobacterales bacterium CwR94]
MTIFSLQTIAIAAAALGLSVVLPCVGQYSGLQNSQWVPAQRDVPQQLNLCREVPKKGEKKLFS